ncbi:MAG TPA: hypothetical protein VGB00_09925, partial [Pyrinomonadaceae bacterium]
RRKADWFFHKIKMTIEEEEKLATELLKGKTVKNIKRFDESEIIIRFEDGTEFFIYCQNAKMNLSIADTFKDDE